MAIGQDEYKVKLEVFEGPLDLLLYLIKKDEVDIYDIPVELITRQYMEYLSLMQMLDLNIAGDFIVMAATLMMIKSRMLLPADERPEMEEEEMDPRWELIKQLLEYKKFKDAASFLEEMELRQQNMFIRETEEQIPAEKSGLEIGDVSIFDLISALNEALRRAKPDKTGEIVGEHFTVADKIEYIMSVVRTSNKIPFFSLFNEKSTRGEIVCTFLALLELIRLRQIRSLQTEVFGEIFIEYIGDN
jgi:segregation and condensation protein A